MKDIVRLKGFPNGIRIVIDKEASMDAILPAVTEKFKESGKLFKNARFAVAFEGRENTQEEEDAILDAIEEAGDVSIVCVLAKDGNEPYERAVGETAKLLQDGAAQFYRGNLTNKKTIETEQNIIVLGNVESGCKVVSAKNIIVLGSLFGSAYAGADGAAHFIAALTMEPESIRIGEHKGKYKKKTGWGRKKNSAPRMAYVKDEQIVFEDLTITEELLQNRD